MHPVDPSSVGEGCAPFPSPPVKGGMIPGMVPCNVSHSEGPVQRRTSHFRMQNTFMQCLYCEMLNWVFYEGNWPHDEARCMERPTPHKSLPAVPSAALGTDLRSASSSLLPPGSWSHEGSVIKDQERFSPTSSRWFLTGLQLSENIWSPKTEGKYIFDCSLTEFWIFVAR